MRRMESTNGGVTVTSSDGCKDGVRKRLLKYTVSVDEGGVVELDGRRVQWWGAMM